MSTISLYPVHMKGNWLTIWILFKYIAADEALNPYEREENFTDLHFSNTTEANFSNEINDRDIDPLQLVQKLQQDDCCDEEPNNFNKSITSFSKFKGKEKKRVQKERKTIPRPHWWSKPFLVVIPYNCFSSKLSHQNITINFYQWS